MEFDLVDFTPYYNPQEVKSYELFIGPDGEYYKVKTRYESGENCTHYKWAEAYIEKYGYTYLLTKKEIILKCKTPLEILINYFGFIRYTHTYNTNNAFLNIPNRLYFGVRMSKEQINSLYKLMYFNKDRINEEVINQIENDQNEYDIKIDKLLQKIKDRGGNHV